MGFERVLIAGANGQLARALIAAAPSGIACAGLARAELDITDAASIERAFATTRPDLVINGAAYNLVDRAESDGMEEAVRINAFGPARLAAACREAGVPLVHFSTDFVFDGRKSVPYTEDDRPAPLGVYGTTKLAGEHAVLAAHPRNWAIRVCRLFGPVPAVGAMQKPAGSFPLLMLKLARERGAVRVVNDQVGAPTYTPDLAVAVWQVLQESTGGLYQLCNAGEVTFADYARETFRLAGVECTVEGVSSAQYGAPARRPLYSTLDNAKAHGCGVAPLRHWREALREFLMEL